MPLCLNTRPGPIEVWYRFPKFLVAFIALSFLSSFILLPLMGEGQLSGILTITRGIRTILFAIAFLSIGLETNFKSLRSQILGGRPVQLYFVGQAFNIILTLVAAWLLFGVL